MGRPSWLPRWALNAIQCPSKREAEGGVTQSGHATVEWQRWDAVALEDGLRRPQSRVPGAGSWERQGGGVARSRVGLPASSTRRRCFCCFDHGPRWFVPAAPGQSERRGVRRQEVLAETLGVKGCRGREGPPGKELGAVGLCGSGRNFHPSDPRVACLAGSSQAASAPTCRVRAPTEGPLDRSLTHCCVLDRPLPQQDWPGLCPWVSVPLWAAWVGHHDHFQGPPALGGSWPPLTPP